MLKKKPIIISVGCSFTDAKFFSHVNTLPDHERGGWPIWSDHFKNKLEKHNNEKYEIIHFGRSGGSNELALKNITESFAKYKDRIKFVLWGGTEWHRYYNVISGFNQNPFGDIRGYPQFMKSMHEDYWRNGYTKLREANVVNVIHAGGRKAGRERLIDHGFQLYWTALLTCQKYNATLLMTQLLDPIYDVSSLSFDFRRILGKEDKLLPIDYKCDKTYELRYGMKNPFFKDLYPYRKHFFNLRFLNIQEFMNRKNCHWTAYVELSDQEKKYLIAPKHKEKKYTHDKKDQHGQFVGVDTHPNAAGHKNIADQLWEHYETNFL